MLLDLRRVRTLLRALTADQAPQNLTARTKDPVKPLWAKLRENLLRGKRGTLSLTSGKSPSGIRQPGSFRQKNPSISPVTNQTSKTVTHSETDSLPASTSIVTARPTRSQHGHKNHSEINSLPARSQESQRDQLAPSSHSSLSFLLPPSCGQPLLLTLSSLFLGTFFLALTRCCSAAN